MYHFSSTVNNNVGNVLQTSYETTVEAFGGVTRQSSMDSVHVSYEVDDQTFEAVENTQLVKNLRCLKPVNYKNKLIDMDISESESDSFIVSDSDTDYVENSMSESDMSEVYPVYDVLKPTSDKLTSTSDTPKSLENVSQTPSDTAESTCSAGDQVSPCSISVKATNNVRSRKYDKKFYCLYCTTPQAKLPRHLLTQHKDEVEVTKYEATAGKHAKSKMICRLRNLGNHQHNIEVIKQGYGELVVAYRPDKPSSWEDYVPCEFCLGYYIHSELWKHIGRCPLKPVDLKSSGRVVANSRLLLPVPASASDALKIVLTTFSSDAVSRLVKSDPLILQFGEKLCLRLGHDRENFSNIRNTLRELGRLLKQLRESAGLPDGNLDAFIDPLYFQNVVSSAKHIAGFSEKTHLFTTPSLALKLGHSLKKCSKIIKGNALQSGDEGLLKKSVSFGELYEMTWCEEVSTHALRTLGEKKRNKVKLIPLTKDCQALSSHLKEFGKTAYQVLELCKSNKEAWCDLCAVSLTQVILFNRRRQGEASKMTLEDFEGKHSTGETDVTKSLSPLEQQLCRVLTIIEIVGKRGRTVPVILTAEMKKWISLLIESRQSVGINEANKFVFARANYGSVGHIRGCDCLRSYSEECGAEFPKLLRSTHLRKQIATLSQLFNLKENELDILANFLGHDIRVHREFYRLPEHTLQVAKVSKLLFTLENGQFADQCGKNLDEITVDADEGNQIVQLKK